MKKTKLLALGMLIFTFLLCTNVRVQENPKPVYITVTTMYRNLEADGKDWRFCNRNGVCLSFLLHLNKLNTNEIQ